MCGSPDQLRKDSYDHCGVAVQSSCEDILHFILSSQFVSLNFEEEELFHVCRGSGMGQILSGDVADVCFYNLCERYACNVETMHRHNIWLYARYRDDILIIYSTKFESPTPFEFVKSLKDMAAPVYKVNLDEVSSSRCS